MKKTSRILIYIVVFGLFSSCSHYVVNNAGYIRPPENKKFPYEKRFTELKDLSVIDTTAVFSIKKVRNTKMEIPIFDFMAMDILNFKA